MTSSPDRPEYHQEAGESSGILVIGDDSVCNRAAEQVAHLGDIIFVRMDDWHVDSTEDYARLTLEIDRVAELFHGEPDIDPSAAIIASSRDSQNLLIAGHLQQELDIEEIVVRVNDPQYIDAFADLSVELIDVADIVGAALARKLDRSAGNR